MLHGARQLPLDARRFAGQRQPAGRHRGKPPRANDEIDAMNPAIRTLAALADRYKSSIVPEIKSGDCAETAAATAYTSPCIEIIEKPLFTERHGGALFRFATDRRKNGGLFKIQKGITIASLKKSRAKGSTSLSPGHFSNTPFFPVIHRFNYCIHP
jgi:hypothetical protein